MCNHLKKICQTGAGFGGNSNFKPVLEVIFPKNKTASKSVIIKTFQCPRRGFSNNANLTKC